MNDAASAHKKNRFAQFIYGLPLVGHFLKRLVIFGKFLWRIEDHMSQIVRLHDLMEDVGRIDGDVVRIDGDVVRIDGDVASCRAALSGVARDVADMRSSLNDVHRRWEVFDETDGKLLRYGRAFQETFNDSVSRSRDAFPEVGLFVDALHNRDEDGARDILSLRERFETIETRLEMLEEHLRSNAAPLRHQQLSRDAENPVAQGGYSSPHTHS